MKTLKEYIMEVQAAGYSTDDIESLKKAYRKKYKKVYDKMYAKVKKRLQLTLTVEQFEILENTAKSRKMKTGQFAVGLIFAALQSKPAPQGREDLVFEVVVATRKVGTLINQWVRISQKNNGLHLDHILACEKLLRDFEVKALGILNRKLDLLIEVDNVLDLNPNLIQPFTNTILKHISKNTNGSNRL